MVKFFIYVLRLIIGGNKTKYATHDVGRLSRLRNPGYGWCPRCGISNNKRKGKQHYVCLCDKCWHRSTGSERTMYCKEQDKQDFEDTVDLLNSL